MSLTHGRVLLGQSFHELISSFLSPIKCQSAVPNRIIAVESKFVAFPSGVKEVLPFFRYFGGRYDLWIEAEHQIVSIERCPVTRPALVTIRSVSRFRGFMAPTKSRLLQLPNL